MVNRITQTLHWVDFVMATRYFSSHWIRYPYLNIKGSSPAEDWLCRHKWKAGSVLLANGDWIFTNFRSHNLFHRGRFITTTFQMSFGIYKFKSPICAESRVASFCDFSHKREVQLGAPFLRQNALVIGAWFYTPQFLPVKVSSMDKWFLWELVHYFRFRFYVLFILFIYYPHWCSNLLRHGKVVVAF